MSLRSGLNYPLSFFVPLCTIMFLFLTSFDRAAGAAEKPNIVLLFIDDWAWNGTPVPMNDGMENSRMPVLQMPNIERLAREGMKFTNAYASPQCSPSRVCVQTGQSSPRNGFTVFMNDRGQDYYDEKGYPRLSRDSLCLGHDDRRGRGDDSRSSEAARLCQRPHRQMAHAR